MFAAWLGRLLRKRPYLQPTHCWIFNCVQQLFLFCFAFCLVGFVVSTSRFLVVIIFATVLLPVVETPVSIRLLSVRHPLCVKTCPDFPRRCSFRFQPNPRYFSKKNKLSVRLLDTSIYRLAMHVVPQIRSGWRWKAQRQHRVYHLLQRMAYIRTAQPFGKFHGDVIFATFMQASLGGGNTFGALVVSTTLSAFTQMAER